jgi:UDP-N-acetylmuramyl pentapeptide phosphotransferase/UDP-N-acetylglucosamine-1-phosphate transferase
MFDIFLQFALVVMIIVGWRLLFTKLWILDRPGKDIPARKPVPNFQWIWFVLAFLVLVWVFYPEYIYMPKILGMLVWVVLLFVLSVWDDFVWYFNKLKGRPASVRLVLQLVIIAISIYISGVYLDFNILWYDVYPALAFVAMIFWIWMFINSINRFDGYNLGISSIVSSVWFATIYILVNRIVLPNLISQNIYDINILTATANLSLILSFLGVCSFVMEFKPIGVIRDVGIMFYGFCLWYLSLVWWAKVGMLMTALWLPLLDSIWTVVNRVFVMRKSPMKWDWTHLHYRLLALNWTKNEIRSFVFLRSVFFMNIWVMQWLDRGNKLVIFIWMAWLFFGMNIYMYRYKGMNFEYKPNWAKDINGDREF